MPRWRTPYRPVQQDNTPLWLCAVLYVTALLVVCVFAAAMFLFSIGVVKAQEHHHRHHAHYQNWINKAGEGCCNDQDCGELRDADERTSDGYLEIRIEGRWCPVLSRHYLKTGNVPNASVAHACVWHQNVKPHLGACERLLCYQPKPGI